MHTIPYALSRSAAEHNAILRIAGIDPSEEELAAEAEELELVALLEESLILYPEAGA